MIWLTLVKTSYTICWRFHRICANKSNKRSRVRECSSSWSEKEPWEDDRVAYEEEGHLRIHKMQSPTLISWYLASQLTTNWYEPEVSQTFQRGLGKKLERGENDIARRATVYRAQIRNIMGYDVRLSWMNASTTALSQLDFIQRALRIIGAHQATTCK